jgi:hypothetical protein
LTKPSDIHPADGRLGVLLPGLGAVATTFIAGVELIKKGLGEPIGSLTQDIHPDITGTVTVPEGHDVRDTRVHACNAETCVTIYIEESGTSATYTIPNLPVGEYAILARKELDPASLLEGCYGTGEGRDCEPTSVSPPATGIDIAMVYHGPPPGDPVGTIAGTVTAPEGHDVSVTFVYVCAPAFRWCSERVDVNVSGYYETPALPATEYQVYAEKPLESLFGCYLDGEGLDCAAVTPPATDIDIAMAVVEGPEPPPGDPVGTISGTVTAPWGQDVSGTRVVACAEGYEWCSEPVAVDNNGFYETPSLPAAEYQVYAHKLLENGGLFGCYLSSQGICATVIPPATGIDITMSIPGESPPLSGVEEPLRLYQLLHMLQRPRFLAS